MLAAIEAFDRAAAAFREHGTRMVVTSGVIAFWVWFIPQIRREEIIEALEESKERISGDW